MNNIHANTDIELSTIQTNVGLKFFKTIHKIMALITVAWMSNGLFTYLMPHIPNFIRYGFFALWFVFAVAGTKSYLKNFLSLSWPLLFFYFYMIFLSIFVSESYLPVYISNITYLIMVYSIFLYYFNYPFPKFRKTLSYFMVLEFIIVGINTYIKLQDDPLLSRFLSASAEVKLEFLGVVSIQGVGSFGYFYSLVAVILLLFYMLLYRKGKKTLVALLIITFITILIKAAFTIAILFMFIFMFLILFAKFKHKNVLILFSVPSAIIMFLAKGVFSNLFNYLGTLNWIPIEVSVRLLELSAFLHERNSALMSSDLYSRFDRYFMSIDAFIHNFIAGISVPINIGYVSGGHSAWLDLLAHFGVFSLLFFIFLFKIYQYCIKNISQAYRPIFIICWLYFICLGFVNNLFFSSIFTVWFLFIPLFLKSINDKTLVKSD